MADRPLQRVFSGGQTGVDRAGLDAALGVDLPIGGFCPKGRRAEDGKIPLLYPLIETDTFDYSTRTYLNIENTDGTIVLTRGPPESGTALTVKRALFRNKPLLVLDLEGTDRVAAIEMAVKFLVRFNIATVNIAGPRESRVPGIYREARAILWETFSRTKGEPWHQSTP